VHGKAPTDEFYTSHDIEKNACGTYNIDMSQDLFMSVFLVNSRGVKYCMLT